MFPLRIDSRVSLRVSLPLTSEGEVQDTHFGLLLLHLTFCLLAGVTNFLRWKCRRFRCRPQLVLTTWFRVFPTRRPDTADVSATSCDVGFFFSVSYVVSLPNCRHVVVVLVGAICHVLVFVMFWLAPNLSLPELVMCACTHLFSDDVWRFSLFSLKKPPQPTQKKPFF
jgi:hypothetical protein